MGGFDIKGKPVRDQRDRLADLGGDVPRAKAYATTNLRVGGSKGLLGHVLPGVDATRTAVANALTSVQTYLQSSSAGVTAP